MTLDQLRIFVKVIDAGSFTAAADRLGVQRAHISRVIAQLEARLGVKLLARSTRSQAITEAGREVYRRAQGILEAVDDTLQGVQRLQDSPRGQLRIACGVEFGMVAVGAWVDDYLLRHGEVSAEVRYAARELDLLQQGFDLAISSGPLPASNWVARRLGQFDYGCYASPAYAREQGLPTQIAELERHALVAFSGGSAGKLIWSLQPRAGGQALQLPIAARLRVNTGMGVCSALLKGLGLGQLPRMIAEPLVARGELLAVLPDWVPPPTEVFAVYPSSRYLPPKVRAFVELALAQFPSA